MALKWWLCFLVAAVLFSNHFTRDSVGALEKQIEDSKILTVLEYDRMQTTYFLPNIFTPLAAGMFIDKFGGPAKGFLIANFIACVGHSIFSTGAQVEIGIYAHC